MSCQLNPQAVWRGHLNSQCVSQIQESDLTRHGDVADILVGFELNMLPQLEIWWVELEFKALPFVTCALYQHSLHISSVHCSHFIVPIKPTAPPGASCISLLGGFKPKSFSSQSGVNTRVHNGLVCSTPRFDERSNTSTMLCPIVLLVAIVLSFSSVN